MEGIAELFAELSEPDEFAVQAQLELFVWRRNKAHREYQRRYAERVKFDAVKLERRRERQRRYQRSLSTRPLRIVNPPERREAHRIRMRQWRAERKAA